MDAESVVVLLARLSPVAGDADPERERALAFLGWDVTAAQTERAAIGWLVLALPALVPSLFVAPAALRLPLGGSVLALGAGGAFVVLRSPALLASARRSRGLGEATTLVRRATFRARLEPTPERAAAFATAHGDGPLAASLDAHRRRVAGTGASAWDGFADEWRTWSPSLARAASLLVAATSEPPERRDRLLDRAVTVVAEGTRERASAAARGLRGPVASLYAFGVVLPLALVGALPLVPVAGVALPPAALFLAYDVLLPTVLLAASGWVVVHRPVAFPPTRVPADHPDVPSLPRRFLAVASLAVVGALVGVLVSRVADGTGPLAVPSLAVGAALMVWTRPVAAVRDRVESVEDGVSDALSLVGERVDAGVSLERAIADAAADLDGPIATVLSDADGIRARLGCDVRESFLGPYGALADLPSPVLRGAVDTAVSAAAAADGERLREAAAHRDRLADVEAAVRRDLGDTAATLANTGRFFAPFVGGLTVALATGVEGFGAAGVDAAGTVGGLAGGAPFARGTLVLVVGGYVCWVAALLPALATVLVDGADRTRLLRAVGTGLCSAGVGFPLAVAAGSAVL